MRIITCAALVGAALFTASLPTAALPSTALAAPALSGPVDDGPVDFGLFQGVNDTKGSTNTDGGPAGPFSSGGGGGGDGIPRSALGMLVDGLTRR